MDQRLTFSGHATVALDLGGQRLVTDPLLGRHVQGFLRNRPGVPAAELATADAVLISHLHHDHLDIGSLRRFGRDELIVCPAGAEELLGRKGFTNVVPLAAGESTAIGSVGVRAVPADHGGDRAFSRVEVDPVGYLIEAGGDSVYFAGDTDLFEGMAEISERIDVALVPIWGWGPKLGGGHLTPESAADAVRLLAPRIAVPIHWGTLTPAGSGVLWPWLHHRPPERFLAAAAERAPAVDVRILQPGQTLDLTAVAA